MSGVDVLGVLAETAIENDCPCGHPACSKQRFRDDALAARAAVAQLFDDHRAALAMLEADGLGDAPVAGFLRAALARVGGAK